MKRSEGYLRTGEWRYTKLEPYRLDKLCEFCACEYGQDRPIRFTGESSLTIPPRFKHVCDACGTETTESTTFPRDVMLTKEERKAL